MFELRIRHDYRLFICWPKYSICPYIEYYLYFLRTSKARLCVTFILKAKLLLYYNSVCLCVYCSGGKEHEGDLQYYPFRMTPYLMKVQDAELAEEQFCCLLLAERVHSGYEGKNSWHTH